MRHNKFLKKEDITINELDQKVWNSRSSVGFNNCDHKRIFRILSGNPW